MYIVIILLEIKSGYIVALGSDNENLYIIKYALSKNEQIKIPFDEINDISFEIYATRNLDKIILKKVSEVSKQNETIQKIIQLRDTIAQIKTDTKSYSIQMQTKSPAHLFLTNLSQTLPNM